MKHCCVIGGTGFIGTYVVDALLSRGAQVTVIGRKGSPTRQLSEKVRYISGDYGDRSFLFNVLRGVNEVIDLAYATVPKTSYDDPVQDIMSNLPSAVTLFDVACSFNIDKLVIISSGGTIYGPAQYLPISEEHPSNPISPYGITKLALEKYAFMYHCLKNIPVVCLRPGNAYGERQKPHIGQGFIATAIMNVLNKEEVTVFGERGTVRDYIHASDVALGIVAVLEHGRPGSSYNIGSGEGRSNMDVLNSIYSIARHFGFTPNTRILPPRGFDVPVNILDSSKLKKDTGWEPRVPFEEGIRKTWEYFYDRHRIS